MRAGLEGLDAEFLFKHIQMFDLEFTGKGYELATKDWITVITLEGKRAEICTYGSNWKRNLNSLCLARPDLFRLIKEDRGVFTYRVPVELITINIFKYLLPSQQDAIKNKDLHSDNAIKVIFKKKRKPRIIRKIIKIYRKVKRCVKRIKKRIKVWLIIKLRKRKNEYYKKN